MKHAIFCSLLLGFASSLVGMEASKANVSEDLLDTIKSGYYSPVSSHDSTEEELNSHAPKKEEVYTSFQELYNEQFEKLDITWKNKQKKELELKQKNIFFEHISDCYTNFDAHEKLSPTNFDHISSREYSALFATLYPDNNVQSHNICTINIKPLVRELDQACPRFWFYTNETQPHTYRAVFNEIYNQNKEYAKSNDEKLVNKLVDTIGCDSGTALGKMVEHDMKHSPYAYYLLLHVDNKKTTVTSKELAFILASLLDLKSRFNRYSLFKSWLPCVVGSCFPHLEK